MERVTWSLTWKYLGLISKFIKIVELFQTGHRARFNIFEDKEANVQSIWPNQEEVVVVSTEAPNITPLFVRW